MVRRLAGLVSVLVASAALAGTELEVRGGRFAVNGRAAFLLGISYYGGLAAPREFVERDLDDLARWGFNWVRVWATWNSVGTDTSGVDGAGRAREPFFGQLLWIVEECDRRGMIVDVTLSRNLLEGREAHRRAVETIVGALAARRNWYLDVANERNIGDRRHVSFAEVAELRAAAKRLDPRRLVTASHGGDISREELREYLMAAKVDFVCPHRPRGEGSARETQTKSRQYLAWMRSLRRVVPLHYQEPFRRGYDRWQPSAKDYLTDARGAKAGGAAGWCLHNGSQRAEPGEQPRRSFDLRAKRLFEQLDEEERRAVEGLAEALRGRPVGN